MATSKTTKNRAATSPTVEGLSDNQRWAWGLVLLGVAAFMMVSAVSFLLYWQDDQGVAQWGHIFSSAGDSVRNWGGKLGAVTASFIVGKWFGLFGLCIPIALIILALRLMRFRPALLRKAVRLTLILMILGSLAMAYLFGERWGVFGSGLGGAQGIYMVRWLNSVLGLIGTGLLLGVSIIIYAVYINHKTISVINRVGQEIVDGSIKVGETVTSKAGSMMTSGADQRRSVSPPEQVEPMGPPVARGGEDEEEEAFQVRTPTSYNDAQQGPPRWHEEERSDGFMIVDRSGFLDRQAAHVQAQASLSGAYQEHEDGFTITNYPAAQHQPPIDPAPFWEETDEDGFVVQYPSAPPMPSTPSTPPPLTPLSSISSSPEFVATVPAHSTIESNDQVLVDRLPDEELLEQEEIDALYDPLRELSNYRRPPLELLEDHSVEVSVTSDEIVENKNRIKDTLENFGIRIDKIKATIGPTVTLYEIVPAPGIRISKIKNLEDDIALSLSALGIRIIAPIPGKGTIGIEVPNKDKQIVSMYSVIRSPKFLESEFEIPIVLGKTIQDETFVIDLAKLPHLLVAGATGQGKSVGLNAIITSLLYKKHPAELKLVLVDPKKVELTLYSRLEHHFLAKMPGEDDAIITDTHKVIYTLNSLCIEMDSRYDLLRKAEVRHVKEYNDKFKNRRLNPNKGHRFLPYIVVIIDEFADLIMTAGREVETPLARIAQLARAVGIHLVIATQRPTTNIITGVIKANFPARIAFRVTSMIDSRTIIDQPGANQLIGRGDMLVSTGNDMIRVQCAFVDTPEIERITDFISQQQRYAGAYELPEYVPDGGDTSARKSADMGQIDPMFEEVAHFVVQNQQGSTSSIQRRFSIGYNRAGRIMDQLEMAGVVGRAEGSKPREVLITDMISLEHLLQHLND